MYMKTKKRDVHKASLVKKTADICGVSESYVYKILDCDRDNENVMATYMTLMQGENQLLEEVKKLVPFTF